MKKESKKNNVKGKDSVEGNSSDDEIKLLEQFAEKLEKQNLVIKKLLEQNNSKKTSNT